MGKSSFLNLNCGEIMKVKKKIKIIKLKNLFLANEKKKNIIFIFFFLIKITTTKTVKINKKIKMLKIKKTITS